MMRLDKYLSHSGFGTRSEVAKIIKKKNVIVNNDVINKAGYNIDENNDLVYVDGLLVDYQKYYYIMMNKPKGYVCANEDNVYPTVFSLMEDFQDINLFSVGRLDVDTTGLLLITNDGDFNHNIISPKKEKIKIYNAIINGFINQSNIEEFTKGVIISGGYQCKPATLKELEKYDTTSKVEIGISEGKFHQVKLMVKAINLEVIELERVKIGNLELDPSLELGDYRLLEESEIHNL